MTTKTTMTWDDVPIPNLIRHIMMTYHRDHLEQLPVLRKQLTAVVEAHPEANEQLGALEIALRQLQFLLEHHQMKEETRLFPLLSRGKFAEAASAIEVMREEHRQLDALLARVVELTGGFKEPPGCDRPWWRVWKGLKRLHQQILEHSQLEENVLFVRALAKVPPEGNPAE